MIKHVHMSVDKVRELIRLNPFIGQEKIATKLGLDLATVETIVKDHLRLGQINRRWTPLTLSPAQREQRLDWANFVLEKSKRADRFVARFDAFIYKCADYWTFDPHDDTFVEKRTIVSFYSAKGVHAVASILDPRLLSSPELLDSGLRNEGQKRYLYVEGTTYNSVRLLDNLHDRGVVLVALPECSPDLTLGGAFMEPTHWSHLQRRRFDAHDDGLKEYKDWICKVVRGLGSQMFESWFERISRCMQCQGDYVEQINSNVNWNDYNASWRSIVHRPTAAPGGIAATSDELQLREPKVEPKEECEDATPENLEFIDKDQMKLAIPSDGGYRIVTGPLMLASTIGAMEVRPIARQQQQHPAEVDVLEKHNELRQRWLATANEATIDDKVYPKPPLSHTYLSALAIKNSRHKALPVTAIYKFLRLLFPYYRTAPNGWKNAVRHNLSHSKSLVKIVTVTGGVANKRHSLWLVDPEEAAKVETTLRDKTSKHWAKIKESMRHHEYLDALVRGEMTFVTDFSGEFEDSSDEVFASQLEASSASDGSQDDEVPVPVAKRRKTQAVHVYPPAKGGKTSLTCIADPLLGISTNELSTF